MSVLIKGMKMPDSCSNCELCACYTESKGEVYRCDLTMTPVKHFEKRLHDCPLVEVPPHGRLIDADAMNEKYGDWYTEEGPEEGFIGALKYLIAEQPIIIEADGET